MLCCVVVLMIVAPMRRFVDGPSGSRRSLPRRSAVTVVISALLGAEFVAAFALSKVVGHKNPSTAPGGAAMHTMTMEPAHNQTSAAAEMSAWPDLLSVAIAAALAVLVIAALKPLGPTRPAAVVVVASVLGTLMALSPAVRHSSSHLVQMVVLEYFCAAVPFTTAWLYATKRRPSSESGRLPLLFVGSLGSAAALWILHVADLTATKQLAVVLLTVPAALVFWQSFFVLYRDPFTKPISAASLIVTMEAGTLLGLALIFAAENTEQIGAGLIMLVGDVGIALLLWTTRTKWNPTPRAADGFSAALEPENVRMEVV